MGNVVHIRPDVIRTNKKANKAEYKQFGGIAPKHRQSQEAILVYEKVAKEDVVVSSCISLTIRAILSSVDRVVHDDQDIADFCNYVLTNYEDLNSTSWQSMLHDPIKTLMWAGSSCSEKILGLDPYGAMILEDLVTYHPNTIYIYPDQNGRLTEGNPSYFDKNKKSGIYQFVSNFRNGYDYSTVAGGYYHNPGQVLLPRKKIIFLNQNSAFGNFSGQSSVAPIYRWVLLKEALIDMMAGALDRYGNPIFYIAMPDVNTSQMVEGEDGMQRALTTFDTLRSQLANLGSQGNALLLPYASKDTKPDVGQIVPANNVGSVFTNSIKFCDEQIAMEMGVPYFLLGSESHRQGQAETEHRMAMFYHQVEDYRGKILNAICKQLFTKLIQYNFDGRPSTKIAPTFSKVFSDRAEDRVATMQVVSGLAKTGALNPQEQTDFDIMRQMLGLPIRPLTLLDKEFYNLLYGVNGAKNGRPLGSSSPQSTARPRTKSKPEGSVPAAGNQEKKKVS